ncbi:MAG: 6,7-dimethyl-8-ribityllumazine synthase [Gemmatimonadota bacterium]|nr:MAG: 6,7-dimethyl-8-ribityllumazine synthase [Gemmatimonadota bacterium]
MATFDGDRAGSGRRLALVVARFNDFVTKKLKVAAIQALEESGVDLANVDEVGVPGAFEIPLAAKVAAGTGRYDAVICLGAVIRGGTPHFDFVAGECARGVARAGLDTGIPVILGVLTTDDVDQALARSGGAEGNKGRDAAFAALEMISVLEKLKNA